MIWVLDASVILKWLLEDAEREPDTDTAMAIVQAVIDGRAAILQPPHWLGEVAAVLARLTPETAIEDVELLTALQWPVTEDPQVMRRATQLAISTGGHLFDTLYHALALEHQDATLITADERYIGKAQSQGRIQRLADWAPAK
ncbi:MAG: type II toxin-antitoxin system VapC family toxin [Steroidobacteraceae bacterium]